MRSKIEVFLREDERRSRFWRLYFDVACLPLLLSGCDVFTAETLIAKKP